MTPRFHSLGEAAGWFAAWLRDAALPLWATAGVDPRHGGFLEALTLDGQPHEAPRRARVQARQAFVYAKAAAAGTPGPWREVAVRGFDSFSARYATPHGLFVSTVDSADLVLDPATRLYEQDFALLAMAALHEADPARNDWQIAAQRTRQALEAFRHPSGGFREVGDHPFQANAHMHLLEGAMAWEAAGGRHWEGLSDEVVALAMTRFIDADQGFLREFFDAGWRPAPGDEGRCVEPGHQFEWAWLLERWGVRRGDRTARQAASQLYRHGLRGVDRARGVAVNGLWDDFTVRDATARLWPQTEYLKAALIMDDHIEALAAANALARYLVTPARGAWRDKLQVDGVFVDEPAPASSFYHLMMAILELLRATGRLPNTA